MRAQITAIHDPLAIQFRSEQPDLRIGVTHDCRDSPYGEDDLDDNFLDYYVIDSADRVRPLEDGLTYNLWSGHIGHADGPTFC